MIKAKKLSLGDIHSMLTKAGGRELTTIFIRRNIFKTRGKAKEAETRARCHVQAAHKYLIDIAGAEDRSVFEEKVNAALADIAPYVKLVDPSADLTIYMFSSNTIPSTIHYKHAESLFNTRDIPMGDRSTYALDLLVVYALRLALESRINGLLGIDYLLDKNGHPVGLNKKINFCKGLKKVTFSKEVNWEEISLVNNWMNEFIHRQLRPHPWSIHQVFKVLDCFLLPGKYDVEGGTRISYYASSRVEDEQQFIDEIIECLERDFPGYTVAWGGIREIDTYPKKPKIQK